MNSRAMVAAVAVLAGLGLASSEVVAQTCSGLAPFSAGRVQLGARTAFGDGTQFFGGGLRFGSSQAFGGVSAGGLTYDDAEGTTVAVSAMAGVAAPLDSASAGEICLVASGDLGFGPHDIGGTGVDASRSALGLGLQLGYAAEVGPQLAVVPTGGLAAVYDRSTLTDAAGLSDTRKHVYGVLHMGVGLVVNSLVSFRPGVEIPLWLAGAAPQFALQVAISLGRPRP